MSEVRIKVPAILPRPYQEPTFQYWSTGPAHRAVDVWARRLGKDLCYMSIALMKSFERKGLYVHFLPEFAHARRTLWDGFTNDGDRILDIAFPPELRKHVEDHDMRIELHNGSVWQLGGSDQYDRWVGGNPIGLVYSEFALAHPKGWELMRPILKDNKGWAAFISTPRGYNHLHQMLLLAKSTPGWHWSTIDAIEAGRMTMEDIESEIALGMPEELARQEYLIDFSAANVGAILGKYLERAEREGRVCGEVWDLRGARIDISSDIGFRDTAAWWFWQPRPDGYGIVDYDEDVGLDAEGWIERLAMKRWRYGTIFLPHDAKARTFATKRSAFEQFVQAVREKVLDCERIVVVPKTSVADRINAARSVMPRCRFAEAPTAAGRLALREWSFKYDEERKTYSKEPDHNWASHAGDAYSYGAQMVRMAALPEKKPQLTSPAAINYISLNEAWAERDNSAGARGRIG